MPIASAARSPARFIRTLFWRPVIQNTRNISGKVSTTEQYGPATGKCCDLQVSVHLSDGFRGTACDHPDRVGSSYLHKNLLPVKHPHRNEANRQERNRKRKRGPAGIGNQREDVVENVNRQVGLISIRGKVNVPERAGQQL